MFSFQTCLQSVGKKCVQLLNTLFTVYIIELLWRQFVGLLFQLQFACEFYVITLDACVTSFSCLFMHVKDKFDFRLMFNFNYHA